jgi:hypothetical protein
VSSDAFKLEFASTGPGRYRLQLQRGTTIEAVSSPIYLEAPVAGAPGGRPGSGPAGASARSGRVFVGIGRHRRRIPVTRGRFRLRCRARPAGRRPCTIRVLWRGRRIGFGRGTIRRRSVVIRIKLNRRGRRLLRRRPRGLRVTFVIRTRDGAGRNVEKRRRGTLRLAPNPRR